MAVNAARRRDCVPPDPFWNANRDFAAVLSRGRDVTLSTLAAEGVSTVTGLPVTTAKTGVHGAVGVGAACVVAEATGSGVLGMLVGVAVFAYLERDRC